MHHVHTLNPGCTHRSCTLRPGSAHTRRVASLAGRVAGLIGRIATHTRAPLHRIAALPPAMSCMYRDTTQRPSIMPVTIRPFVSRHSPSAARPSRARRLLLRAGRSYRSFLGRVVASPHRVTRSYRGHALLVQTSPCGPVSRYSLLYRDSKQRMGSSPSSCF